MHGRRGGAGRTPGRAPGAFIKAQRSGSCRRRPRPGAPGTDPQRRRENSWEGGAGWEAGRQSPLHSVTAPPPSQAAVAGERARVHWGRRVGGDTKLGCGANTETSPRKFNFRHPITASPHSRHTPILQVVRPRSGARLEPSCSPLSCQTSARD